MQELSSFRNEVHLAVNYNRSWLLQKHYQHPLVFHFDLPYINSGKELLNIYWSILLLLLIQDSLTWIEELLVKLTSSRNSKEVNEVTAYFSNRNRRKKISTARKNSSSYLFCGGDWFACSLHSTIALLLMLAGLFQRIQRVEELVEVFAQLAMKNLCLKDSNEKVLIWKLFIACAKQKFVLPSTSSMLCRCGVSAKEPTFLSEGIIN